MVGVRRRTGADLPLTPFQKQRPLLKGRSNEKKQTMSNKLPDNMVAFGILLNILYLTYLEGIKSSLGFLGSIGAPLIGALLVLAGVGVVMGTRISASLTRVGFALTGVALALTGLAGFGVNLFSGSTVAGFALAFLVVGELIAWSQIKIPVLSDFA